MPERPTRLSRLALLTLTALTAAGCAVSEPEPREPPRQVFLIVVDTLRADHLGFQGYPRPASPFLDRLAGDGVVFERAFAASSTTTTSHASLFTALEPPQHGMIRNGVKMHDALATLAETFQELGFETAAFVAVGFLEVFRRGFDVFEADKGYTPASRIVDKALDFVETKTPADRFFVWLHLYDVHEWYREERLEEEFVERARKLSPSGDELARYLAEHHGASAATFPSEAELLAAIDNYDGQLLAVDAALERLYRAVEERGFDNALWILTSDHGEGLGSHRYNGHGARIYNEQLHVPLVFHFTDGRHRGRRVEELARHVDLLPTLAELYDHSLDQVLPISGRSLLPLLDASGADRPRVAFAQRREADEKRLREGWVSGEVYALQSGRYKYLYRTDGRHEFFDLERDPLELENLADRPHEAKDRMRAQLEKLFENLSAQGSRLGRSEFDPRHVEELKALGYL